MLGIFLDSETNGLNPSKHRIIEIAFRVLDVCTKEEKGCYRSLIRCSKETWAGSDKESLKVNGFTLEELAAGKPIELVAKEIEALFEELEIRRGEAFFICQNPSFDRAFFGQIVDADRQEKLLWPYHWLDLASMFWALSLRRAEEGLGDYPWKVGLSKDKIAAACSIAPEEKPHRAMQGVNHLIACYEAVVGFPLHHIPSG